MKLFLRIFPLLFLLTIVGCEPQGPLAPASALVIEHDSKIVRLNNTTDPFTLSFTATCDWHIDVSGKSFTVSPTRGGGSEEVQTVTITPLSKNVSEKAVLRGSFDICLDDYSNKHKIKVMQCAKTDRTIIAYLFGTSLSYYFGINIDCMKQAASANILGNDRLVVFMQTSTTKGLIKEVFYDPSSKKGVESVLCEIDIPTELDGESFGQSLKDIMKIAPAKNYAMIVGGHSTAWLPATPISEGTPFKHGYGYMPNWTPAIGAEVTRTIGEKNVKLDIDQFAEGLLATNQMFDWLYFDVCFMSSVEAAYELRNCAKYIVASPCEIMGYGSPFDMLLDELVADDLEGACRTYHDYYSRIYYGSKSGCIATIVCDELEALAATVKPLNDLSLKEFDIFSVQVYEGRAAHIFFDIEHFAHTVYTDESLLSAFSAQLDKAVINRYHTDKFYSAYNAQMNPILHYSGINFTPGEKCIQLLEDLYNAVPEESGDDQPDQPEQQPTRYYDLEEQISELKVYLPSLRTTAWYKATH